MTLTITHQTVATDPNNPRLGATEWNESHTVTGTLDISEVDGLQSELDGKVDENAAITGATKTKITYDAKGLVTAGADATTADIADSSNKRYVNDAQLVVIGNTSGTNTGDQTSVTGNAGTVTTINGRITAGTNITITGAGTAASPYDISASGGGGSPGGSDTQVQFNDGGAFGGDSVFVWDKTNNRLGVGEGTPTAALHVKSASGSAVKVVDSGGTVKLQIDDEGSTVFKNLGSGYGDQTQFISTLSNASVTIEAPTASMYSELGMSVAFYSGGYRLTSSGNFETRASGNIDSFVIGTSKYTSRLNGDGLWLGNASSPVDPTARLDVDGNIKLTGRILGSGSGNYISWGDIAFGDIIGLGTFAAIGFNGSYGLKYRDNGGNIPYTFDTSNMRVSSGRQIGFSSSSTDAGTAADSGFARVGAASIKVTDGSTGRGDLEVADEAYDATTWNGSFEAPTKNAIRDKVETLATLTGTETLTNKRINPRVSSTASSATPTPNADTDDEYILTALAAGATFGAPTGTPVQGQAMFIRIKDNGTARTLAFNAIYRAIGVTLPTTTVISKTMYIGMVYNSTDSRWDILSVAQEA
jgi:hypothetical protein